VCVPPRNGASSVASVPAPIEIDERERSARGVTSSAAGSSGDPRGANPTSGVIACNGMMVHEPGRHVAAIWNFGSLSCTVGWSTKVHMQLRMHEQGRDQGSSVRRFRSSWKRKKKQKKKKSRACLCMKKTEHLHYILDVCMYTSKP
jgi:hypothetical protein